MKFDRAEFMKRKPDSGITYDVIVAGSGPAGIGAALAAAMLGAKVLILEGRSQFGGTMTAAMWMNWNYLFKDNQETDRGGINRLVVDRVRQMGPDATTKAYRSNRPSGNGGNIVVHPEYMKKLLFDLFDEYEIDYQLYSPVYDVVKEGNAVTGVVALAKQGPVTYRGKVVVDATGDGDVAFHAGCEMEEGYPGKEVRAPISLLFALCNVDTERFYAWLRRKDVDPDRPSERHFREMLREARENGYTLPDWIAFGPTNVPGVVNCNNGTTGELYLDGTDSYNLTVVEKLGIEEAIEFLRFAHDYQIPGMENAQVVRTGGFAAVRETRRLVGEYVFDDKDVLEGTDFEDAVATKYGGRDPVGDIHPYTGIKQGAQYPYRSLLPKDVDGLLVAGRCGSASYLGNYGGKSIGNMLVIGQAAGIAAALCVDRGETPRELDYHLIQEELDKMEVSL
jgi:hypothetical protein